MKINMIKFDCIKLVKKSIPMFIAVFIFAGMVCIYYRGKYMDYNEGLIARHENVTESIPDLQTNDYILYMFRGMELIDKANPDDKVDIPILYVGLAAIFSYIVFACLIQKDDYIIISYSGSRKRWLVGRMLGIVIDIFVIILEFVLAALIFGKGKLGFMSQESSYLIAYDFNKVTSMGIMFKMLFTFFLTVTAISMLQIMITVIVDMIPAFLVSIAVYIISLFYNSYVFIGNGTMFQRYSYFLNSGLNTSIVAIIDVCIIFICIFISLLFIKKKDIL